MAADSQAFVCPDCAGPSRIWRGDVHRWRCAACCEALVGLNASRRYTTETTTETTTTEKATA